MKTVDPLPLREDSEIDIPKLVETASSVSKNSEYPANIPQKSPSPSPPSYWNPACRIQGSLRDPEFQHNGNYYSFVFKRVNIHTGQAK